MMKKLGIVVPSYNESESIASLLNEIHQASPHALVVVVDDSPNLKTVDAIQKAQLEFVHVLHRTEKGGRGSAVLAGIRHLLENGCEEFLEMDADFSHPPAQIPQIIQTAQQNQYDLLIASRYLPQSRILNWPLSRRIFSKLSNILAKFLLKVPVHDYTNGYRFYSRNAAELIIQNCKRGKGFIALSEILVTVYYSGLKVGEISTNFVNRVRGESSLNHHEILNAFVGLIKIYSLKRELLKKKELISNDSVERSDRKRVEEQTGKKSSSSDALPTHGPNV